MNAVKFDDVGRTFTCEPGSSPATPGVSWWWVTHFRRIASLCGVPRRTDRHCRISQASNSRLLRTAAGRQGAPSLHSPDVGAAEAGEGTRRHVERWVVPICRERGLSWRLVRAAKRRGSCLSRSRQSRR